MAGNQSGLEVNKSTLKTKHKKRVPLKILEMIWNHPQIKEGTLKTRRVRRGGALGARAPLPPHLEKMFRSEMSKREEKVPPRYVGKKECARSAQIPQN